MTHKTKYVALLGLALVAQWLIAANHLDAAVRCENPYEPCEQERQPPPPPSSINYPAEASSGSSYTVSWTGLASATSYLLEEKIGTGNWTRVENALVTSKVFSGKSPGTYQYRVQTCADSLLFEGCSVEYRTGGVLTVNGAASLLPPALITYPDTNSVFPVEEKTGSYVVKWAAVPSAGSYILEERTGTGSWVRVAQSTTYSHLIKSKQNGDYTYRVKACTDTAGTVGCSESFRTGGIVNVRLGPAAPVVEQALDSAFSWVLIYGDVSFLVPTFSPAPPGSVALTWAAVDGATGYQYRVWNEQTQSWGEWLSTGAQQYLNYFAQNQISVRLQLRSCNASACGAEASETVYLTFGSAETSRINALAWLIKHQQWDGHWTSAEGVEVPVTAVALEALRRSGVQGYVSLTGLAWLDNAKASSVDAQARRISALAGNNINIERHLSAIKGQENSTSVWGTYAKFSYSSLDTALSIIALRDADAAGQNYVTALCAIARSQNSTDKGWGYSSRAADMSGAQTASQVIPSAYVVKALYRLLAVNPTFTCDSKSYDTKNIADTALNAFLLSKKKPDGAFGDSETGSIIETAVVYGLLRERQPEAPATKAALSNLLSKQLQAGADAGSWMGDAFVTATVLSSLEPLTVAMPDTDGDGVPDSVENLLGTNPSVPDSRYLADREEVVGDTPLSVQVLPSGTVGVSYTHSLPVPKAATSPSWKLIGGQLPEGLVISATGVVSGMPTRATDSTRFVYQINGTPQEYVRMGAISVSHSSPKKGDTANDPDLALARLTVKDPIRWTIPAEPGQPRRHRLEQTVTDIYMVAGPSQWATAVRATESIFYQRTLQTYLSSESNASDIVWQGQVAFENGERDGGWLRVHLKKVVDPELRYAAVQKKAQIEFLKLGGGCRGRGNVEVCDPQFEKQFPHVAFLEGSGYLGGDEVDGDFSFEHLPDIPFSFATTRNDLSSITQHDVSRMLAAGEVCVESSAIAKSIAQLAGQCGVETAVSSEDPMRCVENKVRTAGVAHVVLPKDIEISFDASLRWLPIDGLARESYTWRIPALLMWRGQDVSDHEGAHKKESLAQFISILREEILQSVGSAEASGAVALPDLCKR